MQETRNNCFGSKICSTTLRQAKTGKHECRNITATYFAFLLESVKNMSKREKKAGFKFLQTRLTSNNTFLLAADASGTRIYSQNKKIVWF